MTSNLSTRLTTATLAGLLTVAMACGMNALAGHEYRVASAAQAQPLQVAATQFVTVVGHRHA